MYARAIDEAETRLLELHHEERYQLGSAPWLSLHRSR